MSDVGGVRAIHRSEAKRAFSDADTFASTRSSLSKMAPFWWKNIPGVLSQEPGRDSTLKKGRDEILR